MGNCQSEKTQLELNAKLAILKALCSCKSSKKFQINELNILKRYNTHNKNNLDYKQSLLVSKESHNKINEIKDLKTILVKNPNTSSPPSLIQVDIVSPNFPLKITLNDQLKSEEAQLEKSKEKFKSLFGKLKEKILLFSTNNEIILKEITRKKKDHNRGVSLSTYNSSLEDSLNASMLTDFENNDVRNLKKRIRDLENMSRLSCSDVYLNYKISLRDEIKKNIESFNCIFRNKKQVIAELEEQVNSPVDEFDIQFDEFKLNLLKNEIQVLEQKIENLSARFYS